MCVCNELKYSSETGCCCFQGWLYGDERVRERRKKLKLLFNLTLKLIFFFNKTYCDVKLLNIFFARLFFLSVESKLKKKVSKSTASA